MPLPSGVTNEFVNILSFEKLLVGYPDRYHVVKYVLNGLRNGFYLGFVGSINEQVLKNNKSARDNSEQVSKAIAKEVERGHTAGPFLSPPSPTVTYPPLVLHRSQMAPVVWSST